MPRSHASMCNPVLRPRARLTVQQVHASVWLAASLQMVVAPSFVRALVARLSFGVAVILWRFPRAPWERCSICAPVHPREPCAQQHGRASALGR